MDRRKANPVIIYFIFFSLGITLFLNGIELRLGQSHTYLIDNNYNFIESRYNIADCRNYESVFKLSSTAGTVGLKILYSIS